MKVEARTGTLDLLTGSLEPSGGLISMKLNFNLFVAVSRRTRIDSKYETADYTDSNKFGAT